MAQWVKQYRGLTHETKVEDIENSLRQAVETLKALPEAERPEKLRAIQRLAERLLATRLKALRARSSALTEPGRKSLDDEQTARLRARRQGLQAQGVDGILNEFGL